MEHDPKAKMLQLSDHVLYEWEQLNYCYEVLRRMPDNDSRRGKSLLIVTYNTFLTAFAVHARNLIQFFNPKGKIEDDDLTAVKFVQDWNSGIVPEWLREEVKRANKCAAHLTEMRDNKEYCHWGWQSIHSELTSVWNVFISQVSKDVFGHPRPSSFMSDLADRFIMCIRPYF